MPNVSCPTCGKPVPQEFQHHKGGVWTCYRGPGVPNSIDLIVNTLGSENATGSVINLLTRLLENQKGEQFTQNSAGSVISELKPILQGLRSDLKTSDNLTVIMGAFERKETEIKFLLLKVEILEQELALARETPGKRKHWWQRWKSGNKVTQPPC